MAVLRSAQFWVVVGMMSLAVVLQGCGNGGAPASTSTAPLMTSTSTSTSTLQTTSTASNTRSTATATSTSTLPIRPKKIVLKQYIDGKGSCNGTADLYFYSDSQCVSGNPYTQTLQCDPDNKALHFQSWEDDACSKVHAGGDASIPTGECVHIHGFPQVYECSDVMDTIKVVV